jgi:type IV pilus assembly protein PilQ
MKLAAGNCIRRAAGKPGIDAYVLCFLWIFTLIPDVLHAGSLQLQAIDFAALPGGNLQLQLKLSGSAFKPRIFHTDNPARIALDLPGVRNALERKTVPINAGGAENAQAVEASGRTRVIINLTSMVPYTSSVDGNTINLILNNSTGGASLERTPYVEWTPGESSAVQRIDNVDFRRGEAGEGRVLISLTDPKTVVDVHEEGEKVIVDFMNTRLPPDLARRLDVLDFATPVKTVEIVEEGAKTRMTVTPVSDDYDYSSYQSDNVLVVEFRPLSKIEKEEIKKKTFAYSGEKLSLNFQDIPVRQVLHILADFTKLNIVVSDTVQGNVTLKLENVPWDQALDIVLKDKKLAKRVDGNVIRIAPIDEVNKQEKEELEAQKTVEELEPLKTEIIQVNYTKAQDVQKVLVSTTQRSAQATSYSSPVGGVGGSGSSSQSLSNVSTLDSQSILSSRGNVTVDQRTNQLIVKDTSRNLEKIRELVHQLDKPVRQVLIESRIVIANNDFSKQLGSRLSANRAGFASSRGKQLPPFTETTGDEKLTSPDLLVDLAAAAGRGFGGAMGFTLLKAGDYLLDLELSALQNEGRGEVVSNPRLITSDQTKAVIKQGIEIPYQVQSSAGGALVNTITFKEAVLELNVTPHITPDDHIVMDLLVRKDSKGEQTPAGFGIDKREIQTTAQVENGETVVLGGVYEGTKTNTVNKVPFFGDLPGVGFLFKKTAIDDNKRELLIFITPKVLKQTLAVQ